MDVPGLEKGNVAIKVSPDGVITLSGSRTEKQEDKGDGSSYRRVERAASFSRRFQLPPTADIDKARTGISGCFDGAKGGGFAPRGQHGVTWRRPAHACTHTLTQTHTHTHALHLHTLYSRSRPAWSRGF